MTETTEVTDDAGEKPSRRGRPRPQDTISRDDQVLQLLSKGPLTRTQIAEKLGIEPSHAYLSLFRLNKAGLVQRVESAAAGDGESTGGGRRSSTWQATSQ